MKIINILVLLSLIFFLSHGVVQDFCVGDLTLLQNPSGYACKDLTNVIADDFVFRGLRKRGNTSKPNKAVATLGSADLYPGINGLSLMMARLDLDVGGVIPLHTHPGGSLMIIVMKGTILTGFLSATNVPFYKIIRKYETMIFPQGPLHFQINVGDGPTLAFVSLNGVTPGFQVTELSLFGNNFPTAYIEKTTFIKASEVTRLKALFGSSG